MRLDVVDLARFYATPLGGAAQAMILRRLKAVWPEARGLDVLGLGYATPFLEPYRAEARRVVAAMPAGQGVQGWPDAGHVASTLIAEDRMPFVEAVFDRALVVHLLEEAESLRPVLRELWRVTAPEARIVVIAANRLGLWARAESSPFGQGRSFSRRQLTRLLGDAMFEPVRWARALHAPPIPWGPIVSSARAWEAVGEKITPAFGGVVLVEAIKRVSAATPRGGRRLLLAPAAAPAGAAHARAQDGAGAATSLEQGPRAL
jgi:SAM-dependent methyltransferase